MLQNHLNSFITTAFGLLRDVSRAQLRRITLATVTKSSLIAFWTSVLVGHGIKLAGGTIFQLDKCDAGEIAKINALGLFRDVQKQILCKGFSFIKPASVVQAGVLWAPIIPTPYVGKMNSMAVIDEIVSKCKGYGFLEAQFSDADTLLTNGTLAKKLRV
jgi:hypothetical protein